jgi:hypothetical protein
VQPAGRRPGPERSGKSSGRYLPARLEMPGVVLSNPDEAQEKEWKT